jgi:hypothetical protein
MITMQGHFIPGGEGRIQALAHGAIGLGHLVEPGEHSVSPSAFSLLGHSFMAAHALAVKPKQEIKTKGFAVFDWGGVSSLTAKPHCMIR